MTDDEKKRIEDLLEDLDALPEIPEETDTAIVSASMWNSQGGCFNTVKSLI